MYARVTRFIFREEKIRVSKSESPHVRSSVENNAGPAEPNVRDRRPERLVYRRHERKGL